MVSQGDRGAGQIDYKALLARAVAHGATLTNENAKLREQQGRSTEQIQKLTEKNDSLAAQVEELTRRLAKLIEDKDKNSRNSNKPPSSDALGERGKIRKKKKPTGRKRGGQPGHKGHYRQLVPPEDVDVVVDVFPESCEICLQTPPRDIVGEPLRVQVVDLLDNGARQTIEYRLHTVECECGEHVTADREQAPTSAFGPRLKSAVANLTGGYQLSRRQVPAFLNDMFGIKMSLGSVSNIEGQMSTALATPSDEALQEVQAASVKHIDETSWVRDFDPCSAWVMASAGISVFRIVKDGRRATLLKALWSKHRGILVSDRAAVFLFWSMKKRQVCWSHLQRAFVGFSQRDGPVGAWGRDLATCAELVFGYWRQYRSGALTGKRFEQWMEAVRTKTKQILERAANAGIARVSGSCANMLKHWEAMWTFVKTPGVGPTNNHAERELRRLVIWRRRCFGTQSERGDRFVERMMTVTHTLRKQGRRVLSYLQKCLLATISTAPMPQLAPSR